MAGKAMTTVQMTEKSQMMIPKGARQPKIRY